MESSTISKSAQDKTFPCLVLLLLPLLSPGAKSPHQVKLLTWQVLSQTGEVVWEISQQHSLNTWWPTLTPDFCQLAAGLDTWDIPDKSHDVGALNVSNLGCPKPYSPGCACPRARCHLAHNDFYVCPKDGRSQAQAHKCGGYAHYFCASWGCETTGDAYWNPSSSWDLITVKRGFRRTRDSKRGGAVDGSLCPAGDTGGPMAAGLSLPLRISFTEQGKKFLKWSSGRTWGLRWNLNYGDRGVIFKIKLKISDIQSAPIGPNLALPEQRAPALARPAVPRTPVSTQAPAKGPLFQTTPPVTYLETSDRLLNLVKGAYLALNSTSPEKVKSCWLCLNPNPPYYEGIALSSNVTNFTNPSEACRRSDHSLTLSQVSGSGLCIGSPPSKIKAALCSTTLKVWTGPYYLVPPNGTFWACSTGLTPCVSAAVLNQTHDYCVLVQLWPRMSYHTDEVVLNYHEWSDFRTRQKREPVALVTLAMLLGVGGVAAGIGTGTTALIKTDKYEALHNAMNDDLRAAEQAIRDLKDSVTSLSEVVLQNRRGLDLLFLKEGGLCAALKEECCFYIDKTGLVTETLDKLKERLDKRKREFESRQSWYEGIWNKSPWFTTLVSSLMGPLILLLLILTFGPCIVNRLTQFVKDRLSIVQAMVLTQQYQALKQQESGL